MTDAEKKKLWDDLVKRDPQMAQTLKAHMKVFGKPVEIRVRWL